MMTEQIIENGVKGTPLISICIPAWQDAAGPLLSSLRALPAIAQCEVLVYDDGSGNEDMTRAITNSLAAIKAPARLITASENRGRSVARNRLIAQARADWLLLLDADMLPDGPDFLQNYINAITQTACPALFAGGFSLKQVEATPLQRLHAAQARKSECIPADIRAKAPGLHIFTSNILVHREIIESVLFDEGYTGWGWEDVDWGLRVNAAYPVKHIENTATHLGLDDADNLLKKYAGSQDNFARLASQHPDEVGKMRIYQVSQKMRAIPLRGLIGKITRGLARDPLGLVPLSLRLFSLKLFRATIYAEALK